MLQVSLPASRKSIGAEVNYGIRFQTQQHASTFLEGLSREVAKRLAFCGSRGHTITLKLKRRRENAPKEPAKFLGHGLCNSFSKSLTVRQSIGSAEDICAAAQSLFNTMAIPPDEVRGVGIVVSKFEGQQERAGRPEDAHTRQGTLLSSLWNADATKAHASGAKVATSDSANGLAGQHESVWCDAERVAMELGDVCDEALSDDDLPNNAEAVWQDTPSLKNAGKSMLSAGVLSCGPCCSFLVVTSRCCRSWIHAPARTSAAPSCSVQHLFSHET